MEAAATIDRQTGPSIFGTNRTKHNRTPQRCSSTTCATAVSAVRIGRRTGWESRFLSKWHNAVANAFGEQVSYGILVKNYTNPESGRYAPPSLCTADRREQWGIQNPRTICTSHVERNNLTIRTFMKRFARLSLGFSKKLPNLRAAVALHVFVYNFCRIHGSLKVTPAMKAGVTDRLWSLEDLFG